MHVIVLPKPGKDLNNSKKLQVDSFLCHLYNIFERVITNCMKDKIDSYLIKQQVGFRPGKSCTGQVLNLTQYVEDGFETHSVTGVVFMVDLTTAFDTVYHHTLRKKVYELTKDFVFTKIINMLLKYQRFYVTLNGKILSLTFFNLYTNDQPIGQHTHHFLYADDVILTTKHKAFKVL